MRDDQFVDGTFTWFIGVIEDVIDPKKRNRVKVRCFGYHTDDKGILPVVDLPWATVMMPNTSPSVDGIGMNHQLLEGSWVVGFFRDGPSAQDPIVMGSMASFTEEAPNTEKGFTGRFGITANTEDVPEEVDSFNDNQVIKTVGGHLIELDNALDSERINIKHKSGTTILIDKDGGIQIDAVNDIVNIDGNTTITGTLTVSEATSLQSTLDVTGAQTNSSTIVAEDTITDSGATLATHTHIGDSGGNTGSPN
tara:strand:- start:253 stop:1005 length:753 start_codon:yes stop_codon:yes gene_type:complete